MEFEINDDLINCVRDAEGGKTREMQAQRCLTTTPFFSKICKNYTKLHQ